VWRYCHSPGISAKPVAPTGAYSHKYFLQILVCLKKMHVPVDVLVPIHPPVVVVLVGDAVEEEKLLLALAACTLQIERELGDACVRVCARV
jgi:hypothetical protein